MWLNFRIEITADLPEGKAKKSRIKKGILSACIYDTIAFHAFSSHYHNAAYNNTVVNDIVYFLNNGKLREKDPNTPLFTPTATAWLRGNVVVNSLHYTDADKTDDDVYFDYDDGEITTQTDIFELLFNKAVRGEIVCVIIFHDGSSTQYAGSKARFAQSYFGTYNKTKGGKPIRIQRIRCISAHGKGPSDGANTMVRFVTLRAMQTGVNILPGVHALARAMAIHYKSHYTNNLSPAKPHKGKFTDVCIFFYPANGMHEDLVNTDDVFKGIMSYYFFESAGIHGLMASERVCVCPNCLKSKRAECTFPGKFGTLVHPKIKPAEAKAVVRTQTAAVGSIATFAATVKARDHLVMRIASSERTNDDQEYFIAQVIKKPWQLLKAETHSMTTFDQGFYVVTIQWKKLREVIPNLGDRIYEKEMIPEQVVSLNSVLFSAHKYVNEPAIEWRPGIRAWVLKAETDAKIRKYCATGF